MSIPWLKGCAHAALGQPVPVEGYRGVVYCRVKAHGRVHYLAGYQYLDSIGTGIVDLEFPHPTLADAAQVAITKAAEAEGRRCVSTR